MNRKDLVLALLLVTIWGATFTVIKLGLGGVPPMLLAAFRFVFAALPAVFFVRRPAVGPRYWVTYGIAVGVCQFGCLFYAMHTGMPAGVASVVVQSQAFFTLAFATIFLRESASDSQITGLGIASVGLVLVGHNVGGTSVFAIPPAALLLTLASAAFWGISNIIVRKATASATSQGKRLDVLSLVVWSSLVPPVPLFLLALLLDTPETVIGAITALDGVSVFSILYLSFGATLFGFGVWSRLLSRHPANLVAPLSLLVPVTGLLTAWLILGEQLSILQWGGCLTVIFGLLVSTFGLQAFRRLVPARVR
ncbi:MAG: EamA family transporter [Desulfatirhabdiaceae bacterium]|nr:EamA family transporter [Desulfatirhabdiaceae bacterium]